MEAGDEKQAVAVAPREPRSIVRTPGTCGGKPRLDGTRIRVQDIYVWHELGRKSPDEIVHAFPQLSMADVHAALAFFWAHREEIVGEVNDERRRYEMLKRTEPSLLTDKIKPLGQPNAADDPFPS